MSCRRNLGVTLTTGCRHPKVKAEQRSRIEFEADIDYPVFFYGVGKKKEASVKLSRENTRVG